MPLVKYRHYREYEDQRILANDGMIALLTGSKIAIHTLRLTAGSDLRLSQIFPGIPHIRRFDRTPGDATSILEQAEIHLGAMAVPYVLAIHEDLIMGMLDMLRSVNLLSNSKLKGVKASTMHECLESAVNVSNPPALPASFPTDELVLFHVIREARNAQIHSGGRADAKLVQARAAVAATGEALWLNTTGSHLPAYTLGSVVALQLPELIGSLAVTKKLAERANELLQRRYPRPSWASLVISDAQQDNIVGNPDQRLRKIRGIARTRYKPLALTDQELASAGQAAGYL